MLSAQEEPTSGADVVQGEIEFLITPSTATSRKVLPVGPAQVTIQGVGQSYPISVDCRSAATSRDFLLFAGRTVTRALHVRSDYGHTCVRACVRFGASRGQTGEIWQSFEHVANCEPVNRLMTVKKIRRGLRILRKDRAAKKRAGNYRNG